MQSADGRIILRRIRTTASSTLLTMRGDKEAVEEWGCELVSRLWSLVDQEIRYPWAIGPSAQQRLLEILQPPEVIFGGDNEKLNSSIRTYVSPFLQGRDLTAKRVACWIVKDWGGIRTTQDSTIAGWMESLGSFDERSVEMFLMARSMDRVSSWSKLLAFADQTKHAVYDARVSLALNCGLQQLHDHRRFYMPLGRNVLINAARQRLASLPRAEQLQYGHFITLLRAFVVCGVARSILDAEMKLFASAPRVAELFVSGELMPRRARS